MSPMQSPPLEGSAIEERAPDAHLDQVWIGQGPVNVKAQLRAALNVDLFPQERRAVLDVAAGALGLEVHRWSHWVPSWITRFSMYAGTLGRIILSKRVEESAAGADWSNAATEMGEVDLLATMIHELTHAYRAKLRGAFLWRLLYLVWPPFRRDEELEADAHGLAIRARMMCIDTSSERFARLASNSAKQWTGWRSPYFCWGDLGEFSAALQERVQELLKGGKGGAR